MNKRNSHTECMNRWVDRRPFTEKKRRDKLKPTALQLPGHEARAPLLIRTSAMSLP